MSDMINHPPHYTSHPARCDCGQPIECIQITRHMGFNLGNAVKYLWRAGMKGDALTDLRKAAWYINDEIKRLEGKHEQCHQPERRPPLPPAPEPVPDVILALEDMLEEAMAGRIIGIACAALDNTGRASWVLGGYTGYGVIGALSIMKTCMAASIMENDE